MGRTAADAFPLTWPEGWRRTEPHKRIAGSFNVTAFLATKELADEVSRFGGRYAVISSNVQLRQDGLPYADALKRKVEDPGVAVYFERQGKQLVFACDQYDTPWKNIRAIQKTIDALRGIERWGASDLLERSLSAFEALPTADWRGELGFRPQDRPAFADLKARYLALAKQRHPDGGGTSEAMAKLSAAFQQACKETRHGPA